MKPKRIAKDFPNVCVDGSTGGLDAYTRLLKHLPADMGVAIIIANHLRSVTPSQSQLPQTQCVAKERNVLSGTK